MKLILKNSKLVFAKNIQNQEVLISTVGTGQGVYYWSPYARKSVSWGLSSTTAARIASNPIYIDRTKYNKFKIVMPAGVTAPAYIWFVFAGGLTGDNGQCLHQSSSTTAIVPDVVYDLEGFKEGVSSFLIQGNGTHSFDGHIQTIAEDDNAKVQYIAINVKTDGEAPSISAADFANVKIVLMP